MKRSVIETVLGAVVLFIAGFFLVFSYNTANVRSVSGYELYADFSGIGGLAVGDDVVISGVKIGSVTGVTLAADTCLAHVKMTVDPDVKIPDDTAALISSESLLGGRYLSLEPGASEDYLKPGDRIQYTQAPQNLEQLLGKFIFSVSSNKNGGGSDETADNAAPAAPAAQEAPAPAPDAAAAATPETAAAPAADDVAEPAAAPAPQASPAPAASADHP
jgi:phospholipid/cholesterol/gamma-HCH transport system substrate-binding protein